MKRFFEQNLVKSKSCQHFQPRQRCGWSSFGEVFEGQKRCDRGEPSSYPSPHWEYDHGKETWCRCLESGPPVVQRSVETSSKLAGSYIHKMWKMSQPLCALRQVEVTTLYNGPDQIKSSQRQHNTIRDASNALLSFRLIFHILWDSLEQQLGWKLGTIFQSCQL